MGQQLRDCPCPFLEALSTFREEGKDFGIFVVSTLHHGPCLEAVGLASPVEVSRVGLCPALTLLPSTDCYEEHWNWLRHRVLCKGEQGAALATNWSPPHRTVAQRGNKNAVPNKLS